MADDEGRPKTVGVAEGAPGSSFPDPAGPSGTGKSKTWKPCLSQFAGLICRLSKDHEGAHAGGRPGMSNEEWIVWLRAMLGKVNWTIEVTSVKDRLIELKSLIESKIRELGGKINP